MCAGGRRTTRKPPAPGICAPPSWSSAFRSSPRQQRLRIASRSATSSSRSATCRAASAASRLVIPATRSLPVAAPRERSAAGARASAYPLPAPAVHPDPDHRSTAAVRTVGTVRARSLRAAGWARAGSERLVIKGTAVASSDKVNAAATIQRATMSAGRIQKLSFATACILPVFGPAPPVRRIALSVARPWEERFAPAPRKPQCRVGRSRHLRSCGDRRILQGSWHRTRNWGVSARSNGPRG